MVDTQCYWVHHHTRCTQPATTLHTGTPLCDVHGTWMNDTDRTLNKIIIGTCVFIAIMIIIVTL